MHTFVQRCIILYAGAVLFSSLFLSYIHISFNVNGRLKFQYSYFWEWRQELFRTKPRMSTDTGIMSSQATKVAVQGNATIRN